MKTGDLQACSNGKSEGEGVRAPCYFWVEGSSRGGGARAHD